ncbi:tRNA1(Val) (adenine(37)-N6)-methyltransferase [Salinicoccus sp. RF5]|uniref:tRNA1(Val) (adenine(37)-N6)-methyltransferase n=1 Tax=Salinicoccus sp. RF5 TaxID=2748874 RepID=UPI001E37FC58|nr:tRNA1(Val) (adenine(37)-N6)-methyltransferase [Salinicoccus sp. RF5]MCC4722740.1 tRNA1(Val) (adenine(37)-N6)-methyltransferase [Salinicoccus sp. RF5]
MLKDGERVDELFRESMKIIQSKAVFSFSVDALLLANFTRFLKRDRSIIDLCSGNGIIPLLLSHRTALPIEGVELQPELVDMAERSIVMNGKESQVRVSQGDIRNVREMYEHSSFDVITVNPPYFTNNQPLKNKGPHSIARHEIHIDLKGVIGAARFLVKNKGRLYMVHRAERSMEVVNELFNAGFRVRRLQYVYNDMTSGTALFVLIEAIFNSQAYADVLPPLYIYDLQGNYTEEMLAVYYG